MKPENYSTIINARVKAAGWLVFAMLFSGLLVGIYYNSFIKRMELYKEDCTEWTTKYEKEEMIFQKTALQIRQMDSTLNLLINESENYINFANQPSFQTNQLVRNINDYETGVRETLKQLKFNNKYSEFKELYDALAIKYESKLIDLKHNRNWFVMPAPVPIDTTTILSCDLQIQRLNIEVQNKLGVIDNLTYQNSMKRDQIQTLRIEKQQIRADLSTCEQTLAKKMGESKMPKVKPVLNVDPRKQEKIQSFDELLKWWKGVQEITHKRKRKKLTGVQLVYEGFNNNKEVMDTLKQYIE